MKKHKTLFSGNLLITSLYLTGVESHFGGKSLSFLFSQCFWGRTLWCSQAESHDLHFGNRNKTRMGMELGPRMREQNKTHTHTHYNHLCCFDNWWVGAKDAAPAVVSWIPCSCSPLLVVLKRVEQVTSLILAALDTLCTCFSNKTSPCTSLGQ